jgi:hypothetical protein
MQIIRFSKQFLFSLFFGLFFARFAYAQEVIDVTKQVTVKAEDAASAKQLLMDAAVEEVSNESIKGLIGEEKTLRSADIIKNKIVKQSGRYILSSKGLNFDKKGDDYLMDFEMKISLKGLRSLLLENGLLYELSGPPKVLPLIQITDRVDGRRFGWWYQAATKEHTFLFTQLEELHKGLRDELQKIGFYSMTPLSSHLAQSVPETYRGENLQRADYLFLGEYFKSSVVIRGQVIFRLKPNNENIYLIDTHLEAIHTGNGRMMAEVVRTYETEPGPFRTVVVKKFNEVAPKLSADLSSQLSEGWKKGTFGASVIRLAVVGKVTPLQLDDFKKTVVLQLRDIKSLRERIIEARKTTYEVDSSVLPQQLAQAFRGTQFTKYNVNVEDVSTDGITVRVDAK